MEADPLELTIDVIDVKFHPPPLFPKQKHTDSGKHKHTRSHHAHPNTPNGDDGKGPGYQPFTGVNRDGSRYILYSAYLHVYVP